MRRGNQELDAQVCQEILEQGEYGVLAVHGDDGYPYAVPLNYVYGNGKLYFHCAKSGHKTDALAANSKASFCVVADSTIVPEAFTTYFSSVIVFGHVRPVDDEAERRAAPQRSTERLSPGESPAARAEEINSCWARDAVVMLALAPEHISGKQAKELV